MRLLLNSALILTMLAVAFESAFGQAAIKKTSNSKGTDPAVVFVNPPEEAKPGVLWMWMGTNLSKQGITKDLEALKAQGFNRTTMFSLADVTTPWAGIIGNSPTPGIVSWTEPWWEMVKYAAQESKRLGMDFGMFNGPGYEASGGKWITPELSMQEICYSQKLVTTNGQVSLQLDKPQVALTGHTPYPIYNGENGKVEIPEVPARGTYYRDIAVIAVPDTGVIPVDKVLNITAYMRSDGRLEWNAPAGNWTIYRFGHTTTGTYIQPAQWEATGLECDKMSEVAVSFHIDHVISEIKKHLGDLVGTGFTHVHFDSYEAGTPSWTPKMQEEFKSRRGYSILPYLPVFAGRTIGSAADSLKFRNDFDATIQDLHRDVYFATLNKKLTAAKLGFLCEPYGGPWRLDDVMPLVGKVMTEFWTHGGKYSPYELESTVAALRKSGQNIIEAEAFTGNDLDSKWDETPAWLKPIGDAAFCAGVNRMVLHRFVQQPFDEKYKPGATMGRWGTHFDRTQTWWKPAKAMVTYWQRCQALLQWGSIATTTGDFKVTDTTSGIEIRQIHRQLENKHVYFVANTSRNAGKATCTFKVTGMQPELWDPVTGQMRNASNFTDNGSYTSIAIKFEEAQSFFVVFRKATAIKKPSSGTNFADYKAVTTIDSAWQVKFDSKWGGPAAPVTFNYLTDWTKNADNGIKYYSGTAVYTTTFSSPITASNAPIYLDLGVVKHIASVSVNGRQLGVIWTAPWRIKIPDGILKTSGNKLTIEVTNVWANRLIGDEQQPADCEWIPGYISFGYSLKQFPDWFVKKQPRPSPGRYCFTTWNYFTKDSPLVPSGLWGPVTLVQQQ